MNVINYTKYLHYSRFEKFVHATGSDTKLYADCWLCEDTAPFCSIEISDARKIR